MKTKKCILFVRVSTLQQSYGQKEDYPSLLLSVDFYFHAEYYFHAENAEIRRNYLNHEFLELNEFLFRLFHQISRIKMLAFFFRVIRQYFVKYTYNSLRIN